jgi:NitT/TauT family transport system substrate-binding protein
MASAYAHGLPIALFAPSALSVAGNMTSVLSVLKASPIQTARDLAGKTIAFSTLRDLQQASALTWMEQNGADVKATNYVEIPLPQMFSALKSGRIDVAMFSEPFYAEARDDVRVIGRPYEALGRVILTSGWVARRDWLAANPVAAQRFVAAVRATAHWVPTHQAAMLQILGKATQMSAEVLSRMGPLSLGESLDPAQIQPIIDAEAKFGYLPHAFPASEMIVNVG